MHATFSPNRTHRPVFMPYVEYACGGRLLFRTKSTDGAQHVPRIGEIVVLDERPYQVVDVEYWARRENGGEPRRTWPTVYVAQIDQDEWQRRLERRKERLESHVPPRRY